MSGRSGSGMNGAKNIRASSCLLVANSIGFALLYRPSQDYQIHQGRCQCVDRSRSGGHHAFPLDNHTTTNSFRGNAYRGRASSIVVFRTRGALLVQGPTNMTCYFGDIQSSDETFSHARLHMGRQAYTRQEPCRIQDQTVSSSALRRYITLVQHLTWLCKASCKRVYRLSRT